MSFPSLTLQDRVDNRARRTIPLVKESMTIGRSASNDIVLNDPEVSKFHAEIKFIEGQHFVFDRGSSNGTLVNDTSVQRQALKEGDRVELGSCYFVYQGARRTTNVSFIEKNPLERTQVLATLAVNSSQLGKDIHELEVLRNNYERLRMTLEAVKQLIEIPDSMLLCHKILEVSFQLINAESGAVLLFNSEKQLVPHAVSVAPGAKQDHLLISRTVVDHVLEEKKAILATDVLADVRWSSRESIVLSGYRSLMCVPLLGSDSVFGVIYVSSSNEGDAFRETDLELVTGIGSGASIAFTNTFLRERLREEANTRESLGRFLSPSLVEQVLNHTIDLSLGGKEHDVVVLFADIRNFTSMTERYPAQDIVFMLNEYFDPMVEIVFQNHGILDKFIGDALMAVWGAPVAKTEDAAAALLAAREMMQYVEKLNLERAAKSIEPIAIGIGIASGKCIAGNMGAKKRMDYTVIGDTVNLASRLSGAAKPGEILFDQETHARCQEVTDVQELPELHVKGKSQPVKVFSVVHRQ